MSIDVREMLPGDFVEVHALWQSCEGIGLNESDSRERIGAFLIRNPGMSAVARDADGLLVGAVLCGDDGRRGYLHHLAVLPEARGRGIAEALLRRCFARLEARAIQKCNIFLFADNEDGRAFWRNAGWSPRADLEVFQKRVGEPGDQD